MADRPPTMEELTNVDMKMIKLINRNYNQKTTPYICKETIDTLLLEAGVVVAPSHSPIKWVFL